MSGSESGGDIGEASLIEFIATFLIPGLGQILQDRKKEGAAFLVVWFISLPIGVLTLGIGFVLTLVVWAVSLYDVYAKWLDL